MKNLEDWFLDRFMPWFMNISQGVGALTILFGLSYCIITPLGWELSHVFIATLIIGFFLFGANSSAKDRRLMKQINDLLDKENDNLLKIVNKKKLIDYPSLDSITLNVYRRLDTETLASYSDTREADGSDKVYKKIKEAVRGRYLGISNENTEIEEANTQS